MEFPHIFATGIDELFIEFNLIPVH